MSERTPPYITGSVLYVDFSQPPIIDGQVAPYGAPRETVPPPTEEDLVVSGKVVRLPRGGGAVKGSRSFPWPV
ncbi:MAG TPA: hypothetical protein VK997_09555 [Deferrisomatales bacterium]|nr:hypothetical protein [Deferrisomatales bacterium]